MNTNPIHLLYKGTPPGEHMSDRRNSNEEFEREVRAERPMTGTEMYRCSTETLNEGYKRGRMNERQHKKGKGYE
jgi:hypothetical protein